MAVRVDAPSPRGTRSVAERRHSEGDAPVGDWAAADASFVAARPPAVAVAAAHLVQLADVLALVPREPLARAIDLMLRARATGRRVYVMGNGGSASTASHFVCDLTKTARVAGHRPLRAFALTDNTPVLTAWANDRDYESAFAEQVGALVEPGDVVVAISASGNSPNVLAGLRAAAERGAHTIGLLGFDGGRARDLAEVVVHVPSNDYGLVEDTHSAITHALTAAIRAAVEQAPVLAAAEPATVGAVA